MGKSTAAGMFEELGIPCHNSDTAVHELLAPGGKGFDAVAAKFPEAVQGDAIDRKVLGALVFNDPDKRRALEDILHPLVRESQQAFIKGEQAAGRTAVVLDIPLLFETGADKNVDVTVTVEAPPDVQRARVLARPGMTAERFKTILKTQMPSAEKTARSNYVVQTGVHLDDTFAQIKKIVTEILAKNA